jgi:RHS repeat-associated protein
VANYEYAPFGRLVGEWGEAKDACPFRWHGHYFDRQTELCYCKYRFYDPAAAKFLSRDPIGEAGGLNLTGYGRGDPINKYDSFGLEIKFSGKPADVKILERFRDALEAGSSLGKALMDRLDGDGFIVDYRFAPPPGWPSAEGLTVPGKIYATRKIRKQLSGGSYINIPLPLKNVTVYLNPDMFRNTDGETDLNLAFGAFIHESAHAYDCISGAAVEPENDWLQLAKLLDTPKGIMCPIDVQSFSDLRGWTSAFETLSARDEFRAVRAVRGIREAAGKSFVDASKFEGSKRQDALGLSFGKDMGYYSLWQSIPQKLYTGYKGVPLPELIRNEDILKRTPNYTEVGTRPLRLRYWWK